MMKNSPALEPLDCQLTDQAQWESNARSYPRRIPLNIVKAKGCQVTDSLGKTYLDCLAGAGSLALGHNHPVVIDAIKSVIAEELPLHTLDLMTPIKHEFMVELLNSLPASYRNQVKIQFCGPTGADAVEAALKLCKTATARGGVLAFSGAYHGMTHGALALMGNHGPKAAVSNLMAEVQFLPFPYPYRCPMGLGGERGSEVGAEFIQRLLNDPESGVLPPAAMILEPIQGEGGVIPASNDWLKAMRAITAAKKIPLIVDEVQSGLGRSGRLFAFEHSGIEPDVIVLSKALGGSLPISVLIYKKELDCWQPGAHSGTFRGNVMAMAAGTATLRFIKQAGFLEQVSGLGQRLQRHLKEVMLQYHCIGDVRGKGLMVGVEIVDRQQPADILGSYPACTKRAQAIQQACLERGLIVELGGRHEATVRFLPPLIISPTELDRAADIFAEAVAATEASQ